jgi:hypothetical protein
MLQANDELMSLVEHSQRGLDLHLRVLNDRGNQLLLVLLPLTGPEGAERYLARIDSLLREHLGVDSDLASLGVRVLRFHIEPIGQRSSHRSKSRSNQRSNHRNGLRNFLFDECGLNDQQVAV